MEHLNSISIRGIVGAVRTTSIAGCKVANVTVATNRAYECAGDRIIETTWHNVVIHENAGIANLDDIRKGSAIEIHGRIRHTRYTASGGSERTTSDMVAREARLLGDCELTIEEQ